MVIGDQPRRRNTNRAEDFDYSLPGSYYVTICTHRLQPMFGEIVGGKMRLNDFGRIVADEWYRSAMIRPTVDLDAFIVMPNHVHGIIVLNELEGHVWATEPVARTQPARGPAANSLGAIVGQLKSTSTKGINRLRNTSGASVWHRNYYDHIIRNEKDMNRIREYIANNPLNWPHDRANPVVRTGDTARRPANRQTTQKETLTS